MPKIYSNRLVNAKNMVDAAYKNHFAIGHFNINNLEWAKAILTVAQKTNTPVILATSEGAIKYMGGVNVVVGMVNGLLEDMNITVPVALHLDHGQSIEMAKKCILAGYSSVMFDGSHLPWKENYEQTKELVKFAKDHEVSVEAEIGTIGGEEDGVVGNGELGDPQQAKEMVDLGIDFLAAGIGNIHGIYPSNWESLSFETLNKIQDKTHFPMVLHGGSGIPQEQIEKAILMGISKLNINTELQLAFQQATRNYIMEGKDEDRKAKGYDPRKLLRPGTEALERETEHLITWFGSKGKADLVKK
ncbi:fructose-bisphosphate aldolase class II [Entomoplasma freundtii]|uniref:Fructose-bisphosphate aldolase n=1 Tax=Entomoplasma freundtii TaxID=74700 RepID=A0A2K8NU11_9MOLU|nr:class II fructose-1,6-bisphosphate aldolase [Entomoplasma freundtii]ATZ16113.1 fructose-bisphosphate aldolase [Entomoplasma freundtii]TDY56986.1 fructose-bisphosphate aldolase class II [Entomoplasma freundtii]